MARIVDGPEITGQVTHKQTGQAYGPVTVTVSPKVYTDREMTASVTSLTTDGTGVFSCYAPPGVYTFTTTAVDAAPIESVEVLGREGGTGGATAASLTFPDGTTLTTVAPRTVLVDVRDYGTLVEGFAYAGDNTTTIQAALTAAHAIVNGSGARPGAIVQMPSGAYMIKTKITVPDGIWFRGNGPGLTELYAQGWGANPDPMITMTANQQGMTKISDLSLGAGSGTATQHGIVVTTGQAFGSLGGTIAELERVVVTGVFGSGFHIDGFECRIKDCYARSQQAGFNIAGTDNFLWGCTADTCGVSGSISSPGFQVAFPNNKVFGCKAFGCTASGFNVGGQRNMFSACEAQDNGFYGFNDNAGDNVFAGCLADTNGSGISPGYGFYLSGSSSASGCLAINRSGSPQTYGYFLGAGGTGTLPAIAGCTSRLPGTSHVAPTSLGSIGVNGLGATQNVAYAATITPDPYVGNTVIVGTLTGAITVNAPTAANTFLGMELGFNLTQDATGGRVVTFAAAYKTTGAVTTTASSTTTIKFRYDGTNWREMTRALT